MIQQRLFTTPEFKRSQTVMFYASFDGEVETIEMMKQAQKLGKKIALPAIVKNPKAIVPAYVEQLDQLKEGPYGIKEPHGSPGAYLDSSQLDLVIVPAVAFDRGNNRLGRGGGYYDRFLSEIPATLPTIGLAFDFQIVDRLPQLSHHDIPVSLVIAN